MKVPYLEKYSMKLQGQNQDEQFESALKKLENEFNELKKKIN